MIEVTIYDAKGNVVLHETVKADTASAQEIADIIALIDEGCPAYLAAQIVKSNKGKYHVQT